MAEFVRYQSGEWSALYVDGKLVKYGDHYRVDEWISDYLGVDENHNDAFLKPDNRSVYETLAEVRAAEEEQENRLRTAQELRAKAEELRRQAEELEKTRA